MDESETLKNWVRNTAMRREKEREVWWYVSVSECRSNRFLGENG